MYRKPDTEACSMRITRLEHDGAMMSANDCQADRQTHTGIAGFCREATAEHDVAMYRIDPWTVVFYNDLDLFAASCESLYHDVPAIILALAT
ncbi:hypothetical protein ASC94_10780 [Massilia sp. Root418]|nr:hypothetical protein ASC94_10780 [Massilia sp. Root418]